MRAKAKSSKTPYPIWVEGEYITKPPVRPKDGAIRPEGHYIDKGGYPGANVYEIDTATFCRDTGARDKRECPIYERDILLWETQEEILYFIIENEGRAVDIVNGEILEVQQLEKENIRVIGNLVDSEGFIESIQYYLDSDKPIPYAPYMDVQLSSLPYMLVECDKCKNKSLSCRYLTHCPNCSGFVTVRYETKKYREKEKALT